MVRLKRKLNMEEIRRIATSRIRILADLAEKTFLENPKLAQRYVNLARAIGKKTKVRLPRELKRRICRHCGAYLWPGANCRVRLRENREPHITITCFNCKRQMRLHYKKLKQNANKLH